MKAAVLVTILLTAVSAQLASESETLCGGFKCGTGDSCCGGFCYSSSTHTCLDGFLCPAGYSRCGDSCYEPSMYSCFEGNLCPSGTQLCGDACYDTNLFDCVSNGVGASALCPKGLSLCGDACYDSRLRCQNNFLVPILSTDQFGCAAIQCPTSQLCCESLPARCYDPTTLICQSGELLPAPSPSPSLSPSVSTLPSASVEPSPSMEASPLPSMEAPSSIEEASPSQSPSLSVSPSVVPSISSTTVVGVGVSVNTNGVPATSGQAVYNTEAWSSGGQ